MNRKGQPTYTSSCPTWVNMIHPPKIILFFGVVVVGKKTSTECDPKPSERHWSKWWFTLRHKYVFFAVMPCISWKVKKRKQLKPSTLSLVLFLCWAEPILPRWRSFLFWATTHRKSFVMLQTNNCPMFLSCFRFLNLDNINNYNPRKCWDLAKIPDKQQQPQKRNFWHWWPMTQHTCVHGIIHVHNKKQRTWQKSSPKANSVGECIRNNTS